jgi:hypothetical protein
MQVQKAPKSIIMVGKMDMPVIIPLRTCFAIAFSNAAERESYFPPPDGINEFSKKELPKCRGREWDEAAARFLKLIQTTPLHPPHSLAASRKRTSL